MGSSTCTCDNLCPGTSGCIAVYVYANEEGDDGECWILCPSRNISPPFKGAKLGGGARVAVEVKGSTVAEIGRFLANISADPLFIPAAGMDAQMTFTLSDTTLGAALKRAGLATGPSGPQQA